MGGCTKMKSIILFLFSLSLATPVFSACASQTQVNIDGFGPVYITTDEWARGNFQVDSNGFTFGGGSMGCTINTQKPFHVSHFQNKQIANVYMSQEGREVNFNICNDGGYNEQFWYSYPGMAVAGGMWGGNNGETGWMDGVTGCQSNCDISRQSARFYNFRVW